MTQLDRRTFLRRSMILGGGTLALAGPLQGIVARTALAIGSPGVAPNNGGYGPLIPVPDLTDGVVRLHLPEGFQYRSFNPTGELMDDGVVTPGRHDGMAGFQFSGRVRLVRNQEINNPGPAFGDASRAYDPMAQGGTTTHEVTARAEQVTSWVSLNGTQMNCAGGGTPWNSWMTCEETVNGPDVTPDFTGVPNDPLTKPHGFIFEVPASRGPNEYTPGVPILSAGRFAHEAVDVDPVSGFLYETEDNFGFPSGFYRYKPPQHPRRVGRFLDGGVLEMLAVDDQPMLDLTTGQTPGVTYGVHWVTIDEPFPGAPDGDGSFDSLTDQNVALNFVGDQGRAEGGAIFSRLEGIFYSDGKIYLVSTQGGDTPPGFPPPSGFGDGYGQLWVYDTSNETLTLLFESPSPEVLDLPDNIAVSPGGTVLLCEDGATNNFLRGVTADGEIFDFALNAIEGRQQEEFAGSTWAPTTRTLFVNIQASSAISFAIWGPWNKGAFAH
jgi:secreted PhoX family phosphatase